MRYPARHGCPAVFVALVMLFVTVQDALGQANVSNDVETSDEIQLGGARRRYGPLQVIAESIFGSGTDEPFTPLLLRTLFTDGWNDPWIAPPADSNIPVRQGWVNSADGLFFRNLVWVYQNTQSLPGDRNTNFGLFQFQSPLSRRLWISIDVPFVNSLSSSATGFGDLNLTPRVMLHESRRLSVITGLGIRTPTGQLSTLTGFARLNPNVQFWADLGRRVSMRAGTGVDIPLNNFDLLPTNLLTQIAFGQTITGHDVPIFGDFQYYLSANLRNFTSTPTPTFFSLT
ncbi:MAG TPA: transporter, partial [Pirellulales bacterium]|nr:transporter [Pirellulales bacterium]